jgi:hypothetical protein
MKLSHQTILSKLDDAVRWTGMVDRVSDQIAGDPSVHHRPARWIPLLYIVTAWMLILFPLFLIVKFDLSMWDVVVVMMAIAICVTAGAWQIHASGPLGKAASVDDEREAALRKESLLFSLGFLAALNCVALPVLLVLSHWQGWRTAPVVAVAVSTLILNAVLLGTLPTLYASWKSRNPPKE